VPLALAILLTFLLAPAVRLLRSWGLPKPPAVVLVVAFAFAVILGLGALVGQQVTKLAQNLPLYQYNIEEKIRSARGFAGGGMLERVSNFLADLNQEVGKKHDASSGSVPQPNEELTKPVPVEVHQPAATPMQVAERVLLPLVDPLTTAGLVVIFVIFFLSQRQDLRDRLIRLAGSHDLQRTTDAINDGAQRLSRYFVAQTALNVLFGLIVGIGLTFIGVPNPVLFGILAMVLRFVPYIGAFLAASSRGPAPAWHWGYPPRRLALRMVAAAPDPRPPVTVTGTFETCLCQPSLRFLGNEFLRAETKAPKLPLESGWPFAETKRPRAARQFVAFRQKPGNLR
jgi:predicted PurR-regulated permease PerM